MEQIVLHVTKLDASRTPSLRDIDGTPLQFFPTLYSVELCFPNGELLGCIEVDKKAFDRLVEEFVKREEKGK